jgi:hypothetical protein
VFPAQYGAQGTSNGHDVLTGDIPVYLIFAGGASTGFGYDGSVDENALVTAVNNILNSPYYSGLSEYGAATHAHVAGTFVSHYNLPKQFNDNGNNGDINNLVSDSIHDNNGNSPFPEPDDTNPTGVYIVFTPKGYSLGGNAIGHHTNGHTGSVIDADTADDGVVTSNQVTVPNPAPTANQPRNQVNFVGLSALDSMSVIFSHELAEIITDPADGGVSVAAPNSFSNNYSNIVQSPGEIGDNEAQMYVGYENLTRVQSYWSKNGGDYIIPGGMANKVTGSLRSGLAVDGYLLPAGESAVYRMDSDSNANQLYKVSLLPGNNTMVPSLQVYNGAGVLLRQFDGTLNALTGLSEIHTQLTATPNSTLFFVVRSDSSIPFGGVSFHLIVSRSPVAGNGSFPLSVNDWLRTDATTGALKFASDPDGLPMRAELIAGPTNGSLNGGFNPDGSFWYIPNYNFSGADQLTYRVSDANGLSSIATLQINVTPLPAVAPAAFDLTYNVLTGQARAANLLTRNTDPQGLTLQAVLISGSGFAVALPLGQPFRLGHGSLTSFDASGNFVYTPDAGYHGTDSFRYAVVDSLFPFTVAATPTATVTLVIGRPPVAADLVYSTDPNHTLTVSAAEGLVGSNLQTTAHLVDPAPRGLILHDDGSFVYKPPAGRRHLELTFSYYLTNPDGTSNIATVTIQVGDDDPGPRGPGGRPE